MECISTQNKKQKRSHLSWTLRMDELALDILVEQANLGRKGNNGFQKEAYTVVVNKMKEILNVNITKENVINRARTWRKDYMGMKKLINLSGTGWNPTECRVDASDDFWQQLQKTDPYLVTFRDKSFHNYHNLSIVIGDDQATGDHGVTGSELPEVAVDITNSVDNIEVMDTGSASTMGQTRKRDEGATTGSGKKTKTDKMAEALKEGIQIMAAAIDKIGDKLSFKSDTDMAMSIFEGCHSVPEITEEYADMAYDKIVQSKKLMVAFLGVTKERRMAWLRRNIGEPNP